MATNIQLPPHDLEAGSDQSEKDLEHPVNVGRPLRGGHRPVSVMLSPDQFKAFERMYLTPGEAATVNPSRPALGNPTALGVASLTLTLMPLSINWLGWGPNAAGGNLTLVPSLYFTSGLGLLLAAIGEFILGNSFIMLVFASLGGFTLSLGANVDPTWMIQQVATTAAPGTADVAAAVAAQTQVYAAGMGIWIITWGFLMALYSALGLCLLLSSFVSDVPTAFFATKIHVAFFLTFLFITSMFMSWGGSFYALAAGKTATYDNLILTAGSFAFLATLTSWYMIIGLILTSVGSSGIPMGDLSHGLPWKRRSVKAE